MIKLTFYSRNNTWSVESSEASKTMPSALIERLEERLEDLTDSLYDDNNEYEGLSPYMEDEINETIKKTIGEHNNFTFSEDQYS